VPATWQDSELTPTTEASAADIPWREYFTDHRLRSVIDLALANNRDLRMAAQAVEKARAVYRIEVAPLTPSVAADARGERARVPADLSTTGQAMTASQYSVNLGIAVWELDFFGRVRSLKSSALEQFLATEEARTATQISLVSAVATSYLGLAADQESLSLAESIVASQQASYDLIRELRDWGMATDLDLSRARSQVEVARTDVARLSGLVRVNRNALALLVGAPLPDDLLPTSFAGVTSAVKRCQTRHSAIVEGRRREAGEDDSAAFVGGRPGMTGCHSS
jgi:multidrug efflux system outer membrane protein